MSVKLMTESDDQTRWLLTYVLFAFAEILAFITAYQSDGHNHLPFHLSYGLPFLAILPLFIARKTLSLYKQNPVIQSHPNLRLDISLRLWSGVIFSYALLIAALSVTNVKEISGR